MNLSREFTELQSVPGASFKLALALVTPIFHPVPMNVTYLSALSMAIKGVPKIRRESGTRTVLRLLSTPDHPTDRRGPSCVCVC